MSKKKYKLTHSAMKAIEYFIASNGGEARMYSIVEFLKCRYGIQANEAAWVLKKWAMYKAKIRRGLPISTPPF